MKRIVFTILAVVLATALATTPLLAAHYRSGDKVTTTGPNSLEWTGQGATAEGELENPTCDENNTPYLLWVFSYDGGEQVFEPEVTPYLELGGTGSGTYHPTPVVGKIFKFRTPYFRPDDSLTAVVYFETIKTGGGAYILTISHGCPGGNGNGEEKAELTVLKFYDKNANGEWDAGEPELLEWAFTINGDLYSTPFSQIMDVGTYLIEELMPCEPNWVASGITVLGTENYDIRSQTEVEVTLEQNDYVIVYFGNYCLKPSGGFSPGYWSQVTMSRGKNPVPPTSRHISPGLYDTFDNYITDVNPVTLVNSDGSPATFTNALQLSRWIGSRLNSENMAAQLSRHTAAMILNILSEAVDGDAYYILAEMTVQEIVDAAKVLLNANPVINEPGELRNQAEQLKDWLDALNNGASVIPTTPCPYSFNCA